MFLLQERKVKKWRGMLVGRPPTASLQILEEHPRIRNLPDSYYLPTPHFHTLYILGLITDNNNSLCTLKLIFLLLNNFFIYIYQAPLLYRAMMPNYINNYKKVILCSSHFQEPFTAPLENTITALLLRIACNPHLGEINIIKPIYIYINNN